VSLPDGLRPASFRGVPFEARDAGREAGRRLVTHEYPERDEPWTDDSLGRKARRWTLQAFIVGDDAHVRKSALIAACEKGGAATLMHPTEGRQVVYCEACDVRESSDSLNEVEFGLTFVEAGSVFTASTSPVAVAATLASELRAAFGALFVAHVAGMSVVRKVHRAFTGSVETRLQAIGALSGDPDAADALQTAYNTWSLVDQDTAQLVTATQDVVESLSDPRTVATGFGDQFRTSQAALAAGGTTDVEDAILLGDAILDQWLYAAILSVAAEQAAAADYTAYDDAVAVRDDLATQLAELAPAVTDADAYGYLQDLLAALVDAITVEALDLPRLRTLPVVRPVPALALAYDLYGADPEGRAAEIMLRNKLADGNAAAGELRVLTE